MSALLDRLAAGACVAIGVLVLAAASASIVVANVVPAEDGCNTCTTDDSGRITVCTLLACVGPTPRPEPCEKCVRRCEKLYCDEPAPMVSPE